MDIQSVGDRIHNIIDDQNITQTKLAKQIGIIISTPPFSLFCNLNIINFC